MLRWSTLCVVQTGSELHPSNVYWDKQLQWLSKAIVDLAQRSEAPPIPLLRPFDSAQGERNAPPLADGFLIGVGHDGYAKVSSREREQDSPPRPSAWIPDCSGMPEGEGATLLILLLP